MFKTYFNTSTNPVVIDDEGHTIAGGAWGPADADSSQVAAALDHGSLVESARPDGGDINPDAAAAFDQTDALNASKPSSAGRRQTPEKEDK